MFRWLFLPWIFFVPALLAAPRYHADSLDFHDAMPPPSTTVSVVDMPNIAAKTHKNQQPPTVPSESSDLIVKPSPMPIGVPHHVSDKFVSKEVVDIDQPITTDSPLPDAVSTAKMLTDTTTAGTPPAIQLDTTSTTTSSPTLDPQQELNTLVSKPNITAIEEVVENPIIPENEVLLIVQPSEIVTTTIEPQSDVHVEEISDAATYTTTQTVELSASATEIVATTVTSPNSNEMEMQQVVNEQPIVETISTTPMSETVKSKEEEDILELEDEETDDKFEKVEKVEEPVKIEVEDIVPSAIPTEFEMTTIEPLTTSTTTVSPQVTETEILNEEELIRLVLSFLSFFAGEQHPKEHHRTTDSDWQRIVAGLKCVLRDCRWSMPTRPTSRAPLYEEQFIIRRVRGHCPCQELSNAPEDEDDTFM